MARIARFNWTALLGFGALCGACATPPGAEHIVGPDGTRMLHVHCGDAQADCFQLAGEQCPYGYDLSPVFNPRDGNFLVRCKDPLTRAPFASALRAQPTSTPTQQQDGWPPVEVAKPSEPWPPAPTSTSLPPPRNGALGEVDLGY